MELCLLRLLRRGTGRWNFVYSGYLEEAQGDGTLFIEVT